MRRVALWLTVPTGACGLVYEVTWHRYLGTLLGSQSEATAAILAIFLGGLSLGYFAFGRAARRLAAGRPLDAAGPTLRLYGAVECGIGLYAWLFPPAFRAARFASARLAPEGEALAFAFDLALAAALLGPPTVAMGATVPLLTQALARGIAGSTRVHAWVYGLNTLGACAGAIAAGFFLIAWLGLDGVMRATGVINLAAGLAYAGMAPAVAARGEPSPVDLREPGLAPLHGWAYGLAALLLGLGMSTVQTTLNRIGALSLGSSHYTFAIVVAVFVLSIAVGSLAVSAMPTVPRRLVAFVPWALCAALLLLQPVLTDSPYWLHVLRSLFRDTRATFFAYHFATLGALLAVMAVPIGLSGAALPLLFHHLRRELGELGGVAGRLYGWNTTGSVVGALVGGYALFFWLDLDAIYRVAIGAVALAAAILGAVALRAPLHSAVALGVVGLFLFQLPPWQPARLSSGLFRVRAPTAKSYAGPDAYFGPMPLKLVFHRDDPIGSVAVAEIQRREGDPDRSLLVNGKSDGQLFQEYTTMALTGLVPALFSERAERAFVVGYGTGVTVGELARIDSMREVEVAEISRGVIEAARWFDHGNGRASENEKVRIACRDAYRALLRSPGGYDVIASEPSNPWVSGVEMLYALEFLQMARSKLAPGGVYAQWIQVYEIDAGTLDLVLRTFSEAFPETTAWFLLRTDLLLLGFNDPRHMLDVDRLRSRASRADFRAGLERAGVRDFAALLAHERMPRGVVRQVVAPGAIHTLSHPILSHRAALAFFRNDSAQLPVSVAPEAIVAATSHSLLRRHLASLPPAEAEAARRAATEEMCSLQAKTPSIAGLPALCATLLARWQMQDPASTGLQDLLRTVERAPHLRVAAAPERLNTLKGFFESTLPAGPVSLSRALELTELYLRSFSYAEPFRPEPLAAIWSRCTEDGSEGCAQGRARAEALFRAPSRPPAR